MVGPRTGLGVLGRKKGDRKKKKEEEDYLPRTEPTFIVHSVA